MKDPVVSETFCSQVVSAVTDLKIRLQSRYSLQFPEYAADIHCVLEQAEARAWKTPFPHLFLPDLAEARLASILPRPFTPAA